MSIKLTIKDHKQESKLFTDRCIIALIMILLLMLILVCRLVYLQIKNHQFYSTLSQHNILNVIPIKPERGLIYDRNDIIVAKNIPVFNLTITLSRIENLNTTLTELKQLMGISDHNLKEFRQHIKQYRSNQPIPLKINLNENEVAKFYVNQYRFPGVHIQTHMMRYYPLGKVMSHIVGYVGRINQQELKQVNRTNYSASDFIGKVGIEKYYEKALHGKIGHAEAEIDANDHIIRFLKRTPPQQGDNLYLTIDSRLQAFALNALGDETGAIVAIDPKTGEVLALASNPSYDPNRFVSGISTVEFQKLLHSPLKPLYNRAIRGQFSPGSTIKPFFAIAALDENIINKNYKVYDPGWFQLPNSTHIYHDWKKSGHGWVNIYKAIMFSCDTFFYNLAVHMGINRMNKTLKKFGFGQLTGIDMSEELPGLIPSPQWKKRVKGKSWYTGDTVITGIGQGSLLVTPLQLASATATIAEHGRHMKPHLLLKKVNAIGTVMQNVPTPQLPLFLKHPENWDAVIHAMQQVITNPHGTAARFGRHPNYSVAGKTGTAQVFGTYRNEERNRKDIPKRLRNNHLFINFAPVENPKIALAIIVEHASNADKIARGVTDFYLGSENK